MRRMIRAKIQDHFLALRRFNLFLIMNISVRFYVFGMQANKFPCLQASSNSLSLTSNGEKDNLGGKCTRRSQISRRAKLLKFKRRKQILHQN